VAVGLATLPDGKSGSKMHSPFEVILMENLKQ
jgi:hypothetical protein